MDEKGHRVKKHIIKKAPVRVLWYFSIVLYSNLGLLFSPSKELRICLLANLPGEAAFTIFT
jgi:hypothetical protein